MCHFQISVIFLLAKYQTVFLLFSVTRFWAGRWNAKSDAKPETFSSPIDGEDQEKLKEKDLEIKRGKMYE